MNTNIGILGSKIGMTQIFDDNGRAVPVTAIDAGPCTVMQVKNNDEYRALEREIASTRRDIGKFEERELLVMEQLEPLKAAVEERQAELNSQTRMVNDELTAMDGRLEQIETEMEVLRSRTLAEAVDALPESSDVPWDSLHDVPRVLVTGTNGKSTTVRATASILRSLGGKEYTVEPRRARGSGPAGRGAAGFSPPVVVVVYPYTQAEPSAQAQHRTAQRPARTGGRMRNKVPQP